MSFKSANGGIIKLDGDNNHPYVSGLNIGGGGISTNAGIDCHNIGNNDGVMSAKGIWQWGSTGDIKFSNTGKTLGETIDDKIENALGSYAKKGTYTSSKSYLTRLNPTQSDTVSITIG